jgi:photosystem II stability/assembly factor-like uncharacterized protein
MNKMIDQHKEIHAMKTLSHWILVLSLTLLTTHVFGQQKKSSLADSIFTGLEFRNIGPAFMSGRIADIAIHPENSNQWYVAVGSGGLWKTMNSGTTWKPVFDKYASYSTGCITIDENNPHTLWLGSGENVGGRHVGIGDGIYKSEDDGNSWKNMGLRESEHISKIIVHPENSNVLWVAAQGPLWSAGGERGIYKSIDGGKSWKRVLGDDRYTGATDLLIDPRDPDVLYAATWERHRNVAVYIGGGPGSGIHKSIDGGETWTKLTAGLPTGDMGKIGLAISPQKPDVLYAAIELKRRTGAVYRSDNRGVSWEKMSDAVSGATGPHYYQELYACPHTFDKLYLVDVRIQISEDGGKTFHRMKEEYKHSDNHAIAFRKDDPNYLLVGTDGGLYETFDLCENWKFIPNLPITQYYKLAVDDKEPFYTIYGGTQDNNTHAGPSRTDNHHGIRNADWSITLGGDGHQPAVEPGNPDIVYSQSQEGYLSRVDRSTGESVFIQPQPGEGEGFERFNWDAPILVSPHKATRLYFASQRVWKSEDRGDSWIPISGDLTKNEERVKLPVSGKTWSWDAAWDLYAMSTYNTITSLAESPLQEGLIYAGTDDGRIQVTDNGGESWKKIAVSELPGVPSTAFVNDIKADLFDENTVYVALDNHKYGDYKPYIYKSANKGKSWTSLSETLPDKTLVWRLVQDHVNPELLFLATEYGIYVSIDAGRNWSQMKGGVPTISFRDLAIQRRENDLVAASFGRGFFVLDDYSALRELEVEQLSQEATLFSTRDAWWYIKRPVLGFGEKGASGAQLYTAPNPEYGPVFTYYLSEEYKIRKKSRQEAEKKLKDSGEDPGFTSWDALEEERREAEPMIILTIQDAEGKVLRRIETEPKVGFNRLAWNMKYPSKRHENIFDMKMPQGSMALGEFLASPGQYTVTLSKRINGEVTDLAGPLDFKLVRLHKGALKGGKVSENEEFYLELSSLFQEVGAVELALSTSRKKAAAMQKALNRSQAKPGKLDKDLHLLVQKLYVLDEKLNGNRSMHEIGEKTDPTLKDRLRTVGRGIRTSTYGPTTTQRNSLSIAQKEFEQLRKEIMEVKDVVIPSIEERLMEVGAPYVR